MSNTNLFVPVPWRAADLARLAATCAMGHPSRWRAFVRRLSAVGFLDGVRDDFVRELKMAGKTDYILEQELAPLVAALQADRIPVLSGISSRRPSHVGRWDVDRWEDTSLVDPPFHAAFCSTGQEVRNAVEDAAICSTWIGIIDPYLATKNGKHGLDLFLGLASRGGVQEVDAYCTYLLPDSKGNPRSGLPMSEAQGKRELSAIGSRYNVRVNAVVAPQKCGINGTSPFHDRFIAFGSVLGSVGKRPDNMRVVAIGYGVASFGDSSAANFHALPTAGGLFKQTTIARVASSAYVDEKSKYDMASSALAVAGIP